MNGDLDVGVKMNGSAVAREEGETLTPRRKLRPLASLKWPTIPELPAIPDPLDTTPTPLQMQHYTAIAQAPSLRALLASEPRLASLLRCLDGLRGAEREAALEQILLRARASSNGVAVGGRSSSSSNTRPPLPRPQLTTTTTNTNTNANEHHHHHRPHWLPTTNTGTGTSTDEDEDAAWRALDAFAATVERILAQCDRPQAQRGLDWVVEE